MKEIINGLIAGVLLLIAMGAYFVHSINTHPLNQIEIGMTANEVAAILDKEPNQEEKVPSLCAQESWGGDCDRIMKSGSDIFQTFKISKEGYIIVGFKEDRVIVKGTGNST